MKCLKTNDKSYVINLLVNNDELFSTHFVNSFKWVLLKLSEKSTKEVCVISDKAEKRTKDCKTIFTQPVLYLISKTHIHKSGPWLMDTIRLYLVNSIT